MLAAVIIWRVFGSDIIKPGGFREGDPRRFLYLRRPPGSKRRVTSTYPAADDPSNAVSCEKAVEHYKSWSSYKPPSTLWV
jgi:hypothetical protein